MATYSNAVVIATGLNPNTKAKLSSTNIDMKNEDPIICKSVYEERAVTNWNSSIIDRAIENMLNRLKRGFLSKIILCSRLCRKLNELW